MNTTTTIEATTTTTTKDNDMNTTTTIEAKTVPLSKEGAERVTKELRTHGKALVTARKKFTDALTIAKEGHAHVVLGLPSWPSFIEYVLDDVKNLGKGDREYLGGLMAGEGMSSRAIARTLGVSQSTANRMVKAMTPPNETREVIGVDGVKQPSAGSKKSNAKKGKGKGKTSTKETATTKTATTEEATTEEATTSEGHDVKGMSVADLLELALSITTELYDRWEDGAEGAEDAFRTIHDATTIEE